MELHTARKKNHFLQHIDIFGIGINIRFNKKSKYKTKIGGIMTIILVVVLSYQIQLISKNLMDTTNPNVLFEQRFTPEPERYNLTSDKFMMTFGMQTNKSQHYIDPSVYTPVLWIKQTTKVYDPVLGQYTATPILRQVSIEPCTIDHFTISAVNGYFAALSYKNMYCINRNETELYLQGEFDALHYSTLELTIAACSGSNCNPSMNQILNLGRLAVYYVDYSVIPSDKEKPFQPLGRQLFWVSGPSFTKLANINFRNSYLISDYGLIGESLVEDRMLTYSNDREQTTPASGLLFDCYISFEKNIDSIYKRSYKKLDQSLSQLGGIFNIFFFVGTLICKPLSQLELNLKLINSMFVVEDEKEKKQSEDKQSPTDLNQNKKDSPPQETKQNIIIESPKAQQFKLKLNEKLHDTQNLSNNSNTQTKQEIEENMRSREGSLNLQQSITKRKKSIYSKLFVASTLDPKSSPKEPQKQNEINQQTNELKEFFSVASSTISFKGWEYFTNFFTFSKLCHKRKYTLVKKGVEKLYGQIDIFSLVQKMQEIEKLKRLLLNDDQIKLFEYIPKPRLEVEEKLNNDKKKVDVLNEAQKDMLAKAQDAQSAFLSIANSNKKPSKIDMKLLEQLDPKFKSYLTQKSGGETCGRGDLSIQRTCDNNVPAIQSFNLQNEMIDNEEMYGQIASENSPSQYQSYENIVSIQKTISGLNFKLKKLEQSPE